MQIFQNKDTAVIMTEMIHDARIVPLTQDAPIDDDIRLWSGDSRGRWDGDTLVVEIINCYGPRQTLQPPGALLYMQLSHILPR